MTRMIERWFPCAEVSANSSSGWGSGNQERALFTWFAARPTAQAKAAVICSLLPWPDDEVEQARLQDLVREAMTDRYAVSDEIRREIEIANDNGVSLLDPFSGRGIIPLEATRLGIPTFAFDYSPVAVLASRLLTEYPFRDWESEPPLPYEVAQNQLFSIEPRLFRDVRLILDQIGIRFVAQMKEFYPKENGIQPWAYLWAITLPCRECGRRFPLVGSHELREQKVRRGKNASKEPDLGQSFYIKSANNTRGYDVILHAGPPKETPSLILGQGKAKGKSARCIHCSHVHDRATIQRMMIEHLGQDALLLVVESTPGEGKTFRIPVDEEYLSIAKADTAVHLEPDFGPVLPAIPNEQIAGNNATAVRPSVYGAETFGDLMCNRQTLGFIRLSRILVSLTLELRAAKLSDDYVHALIEYGAASAIRKMRRSTRGATLAVKRDGVSDIFQNEANIGFSFDFLEVGIGGGAGSWDSIASGSLSTLKNLMSGIRGLPSIVNRVSATNLPLANESVTAVVTDPPYDAMIAYADSSDLFFCWLKRMLFEVSPELAFTSDPLGCQEKDLEIIVKNSGAKVTGISDHRTREHYDENIARSFAEAARVVKRDGVVVIVFGHGDPDVWQRLLASISAANLVLTGSWPANTESGGQQGAANIKTTLTMACRPALSNRPKGRKGAVEAAIKSEIKSRYPDWERWDLAPTDMLMAASGPAMEIVGRYSEVLDAKGEPVDISSFLPLARAAVQEAMAVEVDHHPLETFDARTRFALWWVRLFDRDVAPKSELRWQALAASLDLTDVRDLVPEAEKGCQFIYASRFKGVISPESAVIDVALGIAAVSDQGKEAMGAVLAKSAREPSDAYLWAAVKFLADRLPDSDQDSIAFNRVMRSKESITNAAHAVGIANEKAYESQKIEDAQARLF